MAHEWDRGVLDSSSWHRLEEVGVMTTATDQIDHGERSGAWPVDVRRSALTAEGGLAVPMASAIVADYREHDSRVVGCVGGRYRATTPDEWRELVAAAVAAGAKPTGAFSLRGGSRVLATFEVGQSNGLRTNLTLADAFDGSMKLMGGFSTIRVVCANTLSAALGADGADWAKIRHTASLEEKVSRLAKGVEESVKSGSKIKAAFESASETYLAGTVARAAFDALFPPADEDASKRAKTTAKKRRDEARRAAVLPINAVGERPGNLATLWNAATYLVDRQVDRRGVSSPRKVRGDNSMLDSMLFGTRSQRVEEIRKVVEVIMADGTIEAMTVTEAQGSGIDAQQIGSHVLADMLREADGRATA